MNNTWKKRPTVTLQCPKGSTCKVRRPGPELALRLARTARLLKPLAAMAADSGREVTPEEAQAALERMDEEQASATMEVARQTVAATVVEPKLYLEPAGDQIGVDDIDPDDFWFIFNWASRGARDAPVETREGVTTVGTVERFSGPEGAGAGAGDNVGDVPEPHAVAAAGD